MKLLSLFIFTACLTAAATGNSQSVTLNVKDAPLDKVFTEIRKQTGYNFLFSSKEIKEAGKVTLQVSNASIEQVLSLCFKNKPFEYSIENNTIVVKQKPPLPKEQHPNETFLTTIDVSGKVTDSEGTPLAGASVKVKGTTNGTTTDANGVFVLNGVDENATLIFSYAEHETVELKVGNRTSISAALKKLETSLQEVVIQKGYYTEKQKYSVGNVGRVSGEDIAKQPINNPLLALQGRVPGLSITQSTGLPGSGVTVRIQGQNSISYGNHPLIIIDGVPYTSYLLGNTSNQVLGNSGGSGFAGTDAPGNPLSFINSFDIESIDILKDADATSIYGSRAANGAIVITTKKGKAGKTAVDINIQNGWGQVARKLDLLDTKQYLSMRREAKKNDNELISLTGAIPDYDFLIWDTTRYTDWQKELIGGTAHYRDAQINFSGGNPNIQYLFGTGYHYETTVFPGDLSDTKLSFHFSLNSQSQNQRFKLQVSANYLYDDNKLTWTDLTQDAIRLAPNAPTLRNNDGSLNWQQLPTGVSTWRNPLSYLNERSRNKTYNLVSRSLISYQIFPGLEVKTNFGYTNMQTNGILLTPLSVKPPEQRASSERQSIFVDNLISTWLVEPQLNYKKKFNSHSFDVLFGATLQKNQYGSQQLFGKGFNTDDRMEDIAAAATIGIQSPPVNSLYKYAAVFGRVNYNFKDKYIFNITARRDGSSRFGSDNLFHNFGSIGGAWIFSTENFFQKHLSFLSYGKVRINYGTTGNDQIGEYKFLNLYQSISGVNTPYQSAPGLQPQGLPNAYLQWEETKKLQAGIDLGFLKDKILFGITYLRNTSGNQLLQYQIPIATGFNSITSNFPARVLNSGIEVSLTTKNIERGKFVWTSNFNLTIPKNKLLEFPGLEQSAYAAALAIGQPITLFKAFRFAGVDPASGVYQFIDKTGNLTSDPVFNTDQTVLINRAPILFGGLQNNIRYKRFELDFLFQFVKQNGSNMLFGYYVPGVFFGTSNIGNQPTRVLQRWVKPGMVTDIQRLASSAFSPLLNRFSKISAYSDAAFSDASFIRLKNVSLSWSLPAKLLSKLKFQSCSLYCQAQNLFTITKYFGLDPETANSNAFGLPPLRVVTVGIKTTL